MKVAATFAEERRSELEWSLSCLFEKVERERKRDSKREGEREGAEQVCVNAMERYCEKTQTHLQVMKEWTKRSRVNRKSKYRLLKFKNHPRYFVRH